MIEKTIANWHAVIRGDLPGGLDELLAEDCVFYSPVVFTPQRGKEMTKVYLNAASATFAPPSEAKSGETSGGAEKGGFRYVREVLSGHDAVLEFETEMGGKYVNGVDMIRCNDEGKIVECKVLIRPLQAINMLHQKMARMLDEMKDS